MKRPRRLEWISAFAILGWGLTFLLPGNTMTLSAVYRPLLARMPEEAWGTLCLMVGVFHIIALAINGREPVGSPLVRLLGGVLGIWIWAHFAIAFAGSYSALGAMSIGVPSTIVFLAADFLAVVQSYRDLRVGWRRAHHADPLHS